MTDRSAPVRSSSHLSSSGRALASHDTGSSSVRPRNRRLISTDDYADTNNDTKQGSGLLSAFEETNTVSSTSLPGGWTGVSPNRAAANSGDLGLFFSESFAQSWSSIQGFTSSLLAGNTSLASSLGQSNGRSQSSTNLSESRQNNAASKALRKAPSWGPAPSPGKPNIKDVAAGSLAKREAALKAARTASVLESHDGVNGGLDITGKHKRRNSDDIAPIDAPPSDFLVYIHHLQPNDTYAGLILRYRCREEAFRRANGLWSRDSIQTRKWLIIPVDECELRGRPCEPPSWHNSQSVDLLAATPKVDSRSAQQTPSDDFFSRPVNDEAPAPKLAEEDEQLWTHVRWVCIDSFTQPVEIGRVSRQSVGYFPPRRRRSIRSVSAFSTPRQSLDLSSIRGGSVEETASRRLSVSSARAPFSGTPVSVRSRVGSDGDDARPAWMRRPGGVGSMGRSVKAPGPGKDSLNSWTTKHIPGLNIDSLPSMAIMGSEVARFGFKAGEGSSLVESSYEDGRDAASSSKQGSGIDKAAAAVETWLRGALAKRPGTPIISARGRGAGRLTTTESDHDLIELTDTASDDGKFLQEQSTNLLGPSSLLGSSSRSTGDSSLRGRATHSASKNKKAD